MFSRFAVRHLRAGDHDATRAASHHVADVQTPISCAGGGAGDVLVGDRDGVVVIPRAIAEEIADPSLAQEQMEAYLNTRIKGGEPLWGIYPPSDETKAQYEAWRAAAADASGSSPTSTASDLLQAGTPIPVPEIH